MISPLALFVALILQSISLPLMMHDSPCPPPDTALDGALTYLGREFSDEVGLIRESPDPYTDVIGDYWKYWLATDNRVAQFALEETGVEELASTLADTLQRYEEMTSEGDTSHGIIEVLNGGYMDIPPRTEEQNEVFALDDARIWNEMRTGDVMKDWESYADLLLYGSLDAYNHGDGYMAKVRYDQAMHMFDGTGFADRFFCRDPRHVHPTYKLALALYTASVIGQPEPTGVREALLAQQACSGGFFTLSDMYGGSVGNTSAEPTAHAILALDAWERLPPPSNPMITAPVQCIGLNPLPAHPRGTVR